MDCESQRNQLAPIVAEQVFPGNSSRGRIAILCNIAKICSRDEVKLMPSRGRKPVLRSRGGFCSRDDLPEDEGWQYCFIQKTLLTLRRFF